VFGLRDESVWSGDKGNKIIPRGIIPSDMREIIPGVIKQAMRFSSSVSSASAAPNILEIANPNPSHRGQPTTNRNQ
jgi:hypothetical protein